jgi:hypothetical protein
MIAGDPGLAAARRGGYVSDAISMRGPTAQSSLGTEAVHVFKGKQGRTDLTSRTRASRCRGRCSARAT